MLKCSYHTCSKEMSVENSEAHSLRIRKGFKLLDNGKKVVDWDGWRFFCESHYTFISKKRIPLTLALVYGPKNNSKRRNISGFTKNRNKR